MIRHELTLTSRKAREAETDLATKLDRIAKIIQKQEGLNISEAHRKYDNLVLLTIQNAIQQIYQLGTNYVSKFEGVPLPLNPRDLSLIQNQTRDRFDAFWRSILRTVIRSEYEVEKPPLNRTAMMSALAAVTTTTALNMATFEKVREVDDTAVVTWMTATDEKVCPICRPIHGKQWHVGDPTLLIPPDDSHINCRCRLLFKDGTEVYSH